MTGLQKIGILVFVLLCGIPGLELSGFGFGGGLSLPVALGCSLAGGVLGGVLVCPRPFLAGLLGGLLAGPLGLLAVYFYTQHRQTVWNLELVLVQGIASLPGVAVGFLIKKALDSPPRVPPMEEDDPYNPMEGR